MNNAPLTPTQSFISSEQEMTISAANMDALLAADAETDGPAGQFSVLFHNYATLIPNIIQATAFLDQYQTALLEETGGIISWASRDWTENHVVRSVKLNQKSLNLYLTSSIHLIGHAMALEDVQIHEYD